MSIVFFWYHSILVAGFNPSEKYESNYGVKIGKIVETSTQNFSNSPKIVANVFLKVCTCKFLLNLRQIGRQVDCSRPTRWQIETTRQTAMEKRWMFVFLAGKMGRFSKAKGIYNDLSVKQWYDRNSLYIGRVAETPVLLLGIVKVHWDFLSNMQWFWWLHTVGPWIIIQKKQYIYISRYKYIYIYHMSTYMYV